MFLTKNNLLLTTTGFYDFEKLSQKESVSIITDTGVIDAKIVVNETLTPVRSLILNDNSQIECAYGQFFLLNKDEDLAKMLPNDAKKSQDGNPLIRLRGMRPLQKISTEIPKLLNFQEEFKFPFIHGYCCASAFLLEIKQGDNLVKDFIVDSPPPEILNHKDMIIVEGRPNFPDLIREHITPINSNINVKIEWLNGFLLNKLYIEKDFICFTVLQNNLARSIKTLLFSLGVDSSLEICEDVFYTESPLKSYKLVLTIPEYNKLINLGLTFSGIPNFNGNTKGDKKFIKNITDSYQMSITYRIEKLTSTSDVQVCCINGISVPI